MKTVEEIVKKAKHYAIKFDQEIVSIEPEIYLKYHLKLKIGMNYLMVTL